ncbi:hypothetical protein M569_01885, partial [Genlisea aurea]
SFAGSRAPVVSSSAAPNRRKPDLARRNRHNWWTPLFGWSSEPDYVAGSKSEPDSGDESERSSFTGCFTEKKAKELRKRTAETSSFHDKMYHSAIAARLASD